MNDIVRNRNLYRRAAAKLSARARSISELAGQTAGWGGAQSPLTGQARPALPSAYPNVCAVVSAQTLFDMHALIYFEQVG